jgi:hypothetical protein
MSRPTTPFFVREKSTLKLLKAQRSRLLTGAYLKLRWKLPGFDTGVKTPMHLWLYCPVQELYTLKSGVASPSYEKNPDFIGVCRGGGGSGPAFSSAL